MTTSSMLFTLPLCGFGGSLRLHYGWFSLTLLAQLINALTRHIPSRGAGYIAYLLLLDGPVMIFNLWLIYGVAAWVLSRKRQQNINNNNNNNNETTNPDNNSNNENTNSNNENTNSPIIVWPYGSWTLPDSDNIAQDLAWAGTVTLTSFLLFLAWFILYILCDGGTVDSTFTDGTDASLKTLGGGVLIKNVAAQSAWRCFTLTAISVLVPAFPLSGTVYWLAVLRKCTNNSNSGQLITTQQCNIANAVGAVMTTVLLLIGLSETIQDDDNGVGIWHIVNATILLVVTMRRLCCSPSSSGNQNANDVLLQRRCYQTTKGEQEQESSTTDDNENDDSLTVEPLPEAEMV